MQTYDVIVIGSGQAGNPLARAMAKAGKKTLIIEKRLIGGTCINDGCTPSKTLIGATRVAWLVSQSEHWGIQSGKMHPHLKDIKKRKDEVVEAFRKSTLNSLTRQAHLEVVLGNASFIGSKQLQIIPLDGGNPLRVQADWIFINAGTCPIVPHIPGLKNSPYLTSTTIMDLEEIPKELVIIGAGYIALELGQLYSRLGAKVTMLESQANFLPKEDRDIADNLFHILTDEGITFELGVKITAVKTTPSKAIELHYERDQQYYRITGSHLLVAAGRKPQTEALGLHFAGVEKDTDGYIRVNDYLETSVKGIYALGDIKGGPAFTHIAYNDYLLVSQNLLENKKLSIKDRLVPYVMFTDPQLGRVGITEEEAKKNGLDYNVAILPMEKVARAVETGETRGLMKAIIDAKTDQILGAAIIGTEAGEIMSVLQVAMLGKVTATEIRYSVFAHPTYSESLENLFMNLEKQ